MVKQLLTFAGCAQHLVVQLDAYDLGQLIPVSIESYIGIGVSAIVHVLQSFRFIGIRHEVANGARLQVGKC